MQQKMLRQCHLFPACTRSNLTTRNFDILRDLSLPANLRRDDCDYDELIPDPSSASLRSSGALSDITPGSHVTCGFIKEPGVIMNENIIFWRQRVLQIYGMRKISIKPHSKLDLDLTRKWPGGGIKYKGSGSVAARSK